MTCPKCAGEMRRYERSGVDIDQCTDCRGIFLDRGELERLSDAEAGYYGDERKGSPSHRDTGWKESGHHGGGHQGRRKKSFLDELFD